MTVQMFFGFCRKVQYKPQATLRKNQALATLCIVNCDLIQNQKIVKVESF